MKHYIIRQPKDLELLLQDDNLHFELAIDQLGLDNSFWQEELSKEYDECGCDAGAIGLLVGLAIGVAIAWLAMLSWWQIVGAGVLTGALSLVIAKMTRLAIARSRLESFIGQIQSLTTD